MDKSESVIVSDCSMPKCPVGYHNYFMIGIVAVYTKSVQKQITETLG